MIIGKVKIDLEELLCGEPPHDEFRNPFARQNCDCEDCTNIIRRDAYYMWGDNEQIEDEQGLAAAVAKFNWGKDEA